MRRAIWIPCLALALLTCAPATADAARKTIKKSIWGPVTYRGETQWPIYRRLGVGIIQDTVSWAAVAPTRPIDPRNPDDPAYSWPAGIDELVAGARRNDIRVSLIVMGTPPWANGGRAPAWAPNRRRDYADFMYAASKRWSSVRHWMVWGEPSRTQNFKPMPRFEATGPRRYARILDAAYGALKRANRRNRVIGGNTFTTGDVPPLKFVKSMRLRNGKPPRYDLWGHNPFTAREPDLRKRRLCCGYADFSDLDTLARYIDRYQRRGTRLFLSEFTAPTDHRNDEFNFYVTRKTQARWLRSALRITRRWNRIYTLGWLSLYDRAPSPRGDEPRFGLMTYRGKKKPSFFAYKEG